jgi:Flp pilus assembly protein TadD
MWNKYRLGIIGLTILVSVSALETACVGPSAKVASTALQAQATAKAQNGDYSGAITDDTEALRLDPSNARLYQARGRFRSQLGDDSEALVDFDQALQLDPSDPLTYMERGYSRIRVGEHQGAIDDLTVALERNPADAKLHEDMAALTYYMRALAYEALNDAPAAAQDWQSAAALYQALGNTDQYQRAQERLSHYQL